MAAKITPEGLIKHLGSLVSAVVWILPVPPTTLKLCVKSLVSRVDLWGGSGYWGGWNLVRCPYVIGGVPLKAIVGMSLCFSFRF